MKCSRCGYEKFYKVYSGWRCENCIELYRPPSPTELPKDISTEKAAGIEKTGQNPKKRRVRVGLVSIMAVCSLITMIL